MSEQTLRLLRDLLCRQTMQVGAADFPEVALSVIRALSEIDQALTQATDAEPDTQATLIR